MSTLDDRLKAVFDLAAELPDPTARAALLDRECAGDAALRGRVEALLKAHDAAGSFLAHAPSPAVGAETADDGRRNDSPTAAWAGSRPEAGAVVSGRYKLIEAIGEGGMGSVWMAEQTEPVRRKVALKLIKAGMDSKAVLARFEAERQALALMDHPNIAKVFDAGATSDGRPFFVMELVRGVPITKFCDQKRLTPRERLELFVPVCQAIQHAHQKGVIHRDVKPSNVLVALYDDRPVPKVIDFGVAKAAGQPLTDKTLHTGFGAVVGTVEYMSPEQASFNQLDVDTRSDVYSLGVLLYELLAGSPPFSKRELEKAGVLEMLRVIREQEPSRPSTKLSSADGLPTLAANRGTEPARLTRLVRGELDWIVMKSLEKDRNHRYETANAFAADVERHLSGEAVLAVPPSAGYRLRKFARRNKKTLATVSVLLSLLLLLGGASGWYLHDRSTRLAVNAGNVERTIATADDLSRKGRLPEAVIAGRTCQALLDSGGGSDQLRQRVRELTKDLDQAERLEEARLEASRHIRTDYDDKITLRAYAAAFREFDLDVERLEPEEIAARIRQRSIQGYLVQALDHWAGNRAVDPDLKRRLMAIITTVDPDPWRNRVREAQADAITLKQLAAAPEAQTQPPASLCLLGDYLTRLGAAEAAVTLLTEAQGRHSDDFWVNHSLGLHLVASNRSEEAIRFFSVAVALRPNSAGTRSKLGWALERSNRIDEAIATYRAAVELNPNHIQSRFYLGFVLAFPKKDYHGAIAQYSRILELSPGDPPTLIHRAAAYMYLGRLPEALADLDEALKRDPKRPDGWFGRAELYKRRGERETAIANYSKAIELKPDYALAINRRLDLYLELDDTENAIEDLTRLTKVLPQDRVAVLRRAGLYRKLHQWEKAIADYSELIDRPGSGVRPPWQERGYAYAECGRFREAVDDFARLVKSSPAQPVYWSHHAMAALAARDIDTYRRVCAEMLKRFADTTDPEIARHIVAACVAAPDAVPDRDRVVKLAELVCSKDRVSNLGLLGAAYFRAGESRRAVECFTERPRTPPRAWDWCLQAMAHQSLGQAEEARKCLDSADKWLAIVGPPGPDVPGKPIPPWYNWQDESGVRLLRLEAEAQSRAVPERV
jgi:serine/threonine protein kinase/Flp pilus assembly protein TadD